MKTEKLGAFFALSLIIFSSILMGATKPTDSSNLLKQIQNTIATLQTTRDLSAAQTAAKRLSRLTGEILPKDVDNKTLANLASLLDSSDDTVRFFVAVSIGNLGPRAKSVAPELLKTLKKADCVNGALTSEDAIRDALRRIGVTPPPLPRPRPDCARIGG